MATEAPAIGIDLGTTYSCVGVWHLGKVEIIANEQGSRKTPSYVAFSDTERLVGEAAENQVAINSANTVFNAKRLIGRKFEDPVVQAQRRHLPFQIVSVNGNPAIQVNYKGEQEQLIPEEISAMVLTKMKETAEAFLGKTIANAVITVPAYFNNAQRQATRNAGIIAGLNVLRIINEPAAAAIAFGLDKHILGKRNVLIFDLGGGTFDVSVLFIGDGIMEVKATAGNTHLGGEDFNNRMVEHFVQEIKLKHNIDLNLNKRALTRLRTACERAKRTLSSSTRASIEIVSLFNGIDFCSSITRARFDELNADLISLILKPIEQVLRDAKLDKYSIDDVVLVGGSTRIPKIQSYLQEFFNGKQLNKTINPDEAVAYGAAIQAAILHGSQANPILDFLLVDVTPLSLGIAAYTDAFDIVVKRNRSIPLKQTKYFTTSQDNQIVVEFKIYEGERPVAIDNHLLGRFTLFGPQPKPKRVVKVYVTFEINEDGILNVTAVEKTSKNTNNIAITSDQYRLSKKDITRMIRNARKYLIEDEKKLKTIIAKSALESYCSKMKATAADEHKDGLISKSVKRVILTKCNEVIEWLDANQCEEQEEYERKHKELEKSCNFQKRDTNSCCIVL